MRRVILLVFCYHMVSQAQPATDEPSPRRPTRELIECCPCPGSKDLDTLASQTRAVDDCPCRGRSADSEGASSLLFPSRTGAGRRFNSVPFIRSNTPKDDVKNLLEPEVGLASSMLETLREATEEEYRDALARDAARDAVPEESRNVVIIVKPRVPEDDIVPELSNVKENRCIHPLGRMRTLSQPLKPLSNNLRYPQARQNLMNLWDKDSNTGASNVRESVVNMNADEAPLSFLQFRTPLKDSLQSLTNNVKNPSLFDQIELRNRPNLLERLSLPLIPKMKVDNPLRKENNVINSDLSPSTSNIHEQVEGNNGNGLHKFHKRPLMLKNLLNLKDVELIPKITLKNTTFKPKRLNEEQPSNRNAHDDCDSSYDSELNEKAAMPTNIVVKQEKLNEPYHKNEVVENIGQLVEENKKDAITSPSATIPSTSYPQLNTAESDETDINNLSSEEITTSTTESFCNPIQDVGESIDHKIKNREDSSISHKVHDTSDMENEDTNVSTNDSIQNVNPFKLNDEDTISLPHNEETMQDTTKPFHKVNEDSSEAQTSKYQTENMEQLMETTEKIMDSKIEIISPISETLSTIKENVKKSWENLKKKSLSATPANPQEPIKNSDLTHNDNPSVARNEELSKADNFLSDRQDTPEQVTFNDLQKLSNDLLVLSTNNEQKTFLEEDDSKEQTSGTQELHNTSILDSIEDEVASVSDVVSAKSTNARPTQNRACIVDENKPKKYTTQSKSVSQDESLNDMSAQASASSPNLLPALLDPLDLNKQLHPLFKNINPLDPLNLYEKVEPFHSLDPLNLGENFRSSDFPKLDPLNLQENLASPLIPALDPLNLGSAIQDIIAQPTILGDSLNLLPKSVPQVLKLPTLGNLREGLASVFDTNGINTENNNSDENGDCKNEELEMASAASKTNPRIVSIKPLDDLSIDIFELNPLSSSQSDFLSKVPRLNLNNFRTKLPLPTNLELKPVKLESRVGNNKGNILGASLTFGDKTASRKTLPQTNILGHSLGNLPGLDELRNTLHSGTQKLLGSSPWSPNHDFFRNSLQSSVVPDIDEFHRNAEKTIKGLQHRMRTNLKGVISDPLGQKFTKPQELLEDVNDKLKGIHYDLNDRLSSIHEDFLEKSRIKPLSIPARIPTFTSRSHSNHKEHNTISKIKAKPLRLQALASSMPFEEIDSFDNGIKKTSQLRPQSRSNLKRTHTNPERNLLGAESSLIPTKVELPRSMIKLPKKSTLLPQHQPIFRDESENLKGKPSLVFTKTRKPSPFREKTNKVTITFATTTPAPVTSPLDSFRTTPSTSIAKPSVQSFQGDLLKERLALPRSKTLGDAKPLVSNITPSRTSTPAKFKNNFKTANSVKDLPQLQSTEPIKNTNGGLSKLDFKSLRDDHIKLFANNANRHAATFLDKNKPEIKNLQINDKPQIKQLVWPKSDEDSFLAKVKEAMQARLATFEPKVAAFGHQQQRVMENFDTENTDMLKSATENNDALEEAPLKESVPYKCRMICTRE